MTNNKPQNDPEMCYYCKKNISDDDFKVKIKLYQIVNVTNFPVGYSFNERKFNIPRCKVCNEKHNSFLGKELTILLVILALLYLWFFYNKFESTFWLIVTTIFIPLSITGLIGQVLEYFFFEKNLKIPREIDYDLYPPVSNLLIKGWRKNRPDPSTVGAKDIATDSPYYDPNRKY